MKMLSNKYFLFFALFFLFFVVSIENSYSTPQSDCFEELKNYYPKIENLSYNDFQANLSAFYALNEPFLFLAFDTPIVLIKFNNMGQNSTLQVGNWPNYSQYNLFELYVDDPDTFNTAFAGCGYMKLTPTGAYTFNNLNSNLYGREDIESYQFTKDVDLGGFRVTETKNDMIDIYEMPFVNWEILRIYYKDETLFFKQYDYYDAYKNATNEYQTGDLSAIRNYVEDVATSGALFAPYLSDYMLYNFPEYESGIGDNIMPMSFTSDEPVFTYSFTTGEFVNLTTFNQIISLVNTQYEELKWVGLITNYNNISNISQGDIVTFEKVSAIQDNLSFLLHFVNRSHLFEDLVNATSGNPVLESHFETVKNNLNVYLEEKFCLPEDFTCGTWGYCSSVTSRSVDRHRNCVPEAPKNSVSCYWSVYSYGSTYNSGGGCSGEVRRTVYYRDVFSTQVSDVCGIYTQGQWIGHSDSETEIVGFYDDCNSGGGGGGEGGTN